MKDSLVDGVNTLDFHLPENVFYNSSLNPENDGYCSGYDCLGNGVFNMSKCQGGNLSLNKINLLVYNKKQKIRNFFVWFIASLFKCWRKYYKFSDWFKAW